MQRLVAVTIIAAAVLCVAATAADNARVRVVCQLEWRDDMLDKPPPESGRTFDLTLPLADVSSDATARQLLRMAEQRTRVHAPTDFINTLRIYRRDEGTPTYRRIMRDRLRDDLRVPALRDGDIVVFHGITDRF
jgi:hypothetical protein